jgi:hypothetical protein
VCIEADERPDRIESIRRLSQLCREGKSPTFRAEGGRSRPGDLTRKRRVDGAENRVSVAYRQSGVNESTTISKRFREEGWPTLISSGL